MRFLLIMLLRAYKMVISPFLPPSCRFYPSCSEYAVLSISKHGAVRGSILAATRLARCHPWNSGGIDLVP